MYEIVSARCKPDYVRELCEAAIQDPKNKARNNFDLDYHDKTNTLLWQFYNGTYKDCGIGAGDYLLMFTPEGKLMGGAGFYGYDSTYVLAMSRFYVMPGFEGQWIGQHLLKRQIDRCIGRKPKMMITFNDYNEKIYSFYTDPVKREKLPPIWNAFRPVGKRTINHCEQLCCELDLRRI